MKITLEQKQPETLKQQLLREGRAEMRADLERNFHARTAAWRKGHESVLGKDGAPPRPVPGQAV